MTGAEWQELAGLRRQERRGGVWLVDVNARDARSARFAELQEARLLDRHAGARVALERCALGGQGVLVARCPCGWVSPSFFRADQVGAARRDLLAHTGAHA